MHLHFTPTYSSWLNQVEHWFARIERDVIARGVFTSVKDLARKLMRYIRHYNRAPKPIKWTYRDLSHRISLDTNSLLQATSTLSRRLRHLEVRSRILKSSAFTPEEGSSNPRHPRLAKAPPISGITGRRSGWAAANARMKFEWARAHHAWPALAPRCQRAGNLGQTDLSAVLTQPSIACDEQPIRCRELEKNKVARVKQDVPYIFIHPAWRGAWCCDRVLEIMRSWGREAYAVDCPGHGTRIDEIETATLADYPKAIIQFIKEDYLKASCWWETAPGG